MKRFRFRLQRVLNYRETVREEKKRLLLLARQEQAQREEVLRTLEQEERENLLTVGTVLSVDQVYMQGLFAASLQERITQQRLAIVEAEQRVQEALTAYIEAAKESEALKTLRTKRREVYDEEVRREDEKSLDELATQRSARRAYD